MTSIEEGKMTYTLKHKDIDVLSFSFNEDSSILTVEKLFDKKHLPIGILNNENLSINNALTKWWNHRTIPASRNLLENGLKILKINAPTELLKKSLGLSLTDHYWICPKNTDLKWHKINYYENIFSDSVGKALFDNDMSLDSKKDINLFSPDNSSDGVQRKKWAIKKDGTRVLIKGGDVFSPQNAFNEVIASEIFERLGIPHAKYRILEDTEKHVFYSESPNFTDEKTEFINASHIVESFKADENKNPYENFIYACEKMGIKRELFEKDLNAMLLVDFIIANRDRHFRNFGFLRDSQTLEWKGLAPVFDSETSLFEGLADIDLENDFFLDSKNIQAKPFAQNHVEQIAMLPIAEMCKNLDFSKLNGMSEWTRKLLAQNNRMSEKRKDLVTKRLEERIEVARNIIFTKDKSKKYNKFFEIER